MERRLCAIDCSLFAAYSQGDSNSPASKSKQETVQLDSLYQQTSYHRNCGLSHGENHTLSFFAFISMRNYSGLLNPVSVNALCEFGRTTAFVL